MYSYLLTRRTKSYKLKKATFSDKKIHLARKLMEVLIVEKKISGICWILAVGYHQSLIDEI